MLGLLVGPGWGILPYLRVGPWRLPMYSLMVGLALVSGTAVYLLQTRRTRGGPSLPILAASLIGGLVGAKAPYLVHEADPAALITYDDPESTMRKVIYALQVRDLGGVFTWELSSDYDGTSQDLLAAMYAGFQRATTKSNPR